MEVISRLSDSRALPRASRPGMESPHSNRRSEGYESLAENTLTLAVANSPPEHMARRYWGENKTANEKKWESCGFIFRVT